MHKSFLSLLKCPICGFDTLIIKSVADAIDGQLYDGALTCSSCKTVFPIIEGIPLLVDVTLQEEVIANWNESTEYLEYNLESTKRVKELVEKYSQDTSVALDAGCGSGAYTAFFKSNELICLDLVPYFLKKLLNEYKGISKLHLLIGDVRRLPFKANSVDLVLCSNVLEHLFKEEFVDVANSFVNVSRKMVLVDIPNDSGKLISSIRHTLERLGFYKARTADISDEKLKHHAAFGVDDLKIIGFDAHGCIGWVSTKYINLGIFWDIYDSIVWFYPRLGSTLIGVKAVSKDGMYA